MEQIGILMDRRRQQQGRTFWHCLVEDRTEPSLWRDSITNQPFLEWVFPSIGQTVACSRSMDLLRFFHLGWVTLQPSVSVGMVTDHRVALSRCPTSSNLACFYPSQLSTDTQLCRWLPLGCEEAIASWNQGIGYSQSYLTSLYSSLVALQCRRATIQGSQKLKVESQGQVTGHLRFTLKSYAHATWSMAILLASDGPRIVAF